MEMEKAIYHIVGVENMTEHENNDNIEWEHETSEADIQVVGFNSILDEIMGMILFMLDRYDCLKGSIWIC